MLASGARDVLELLPSSWVLSAVVVVSREVVMPSSIGRLPEIEKRHGDEAARASFSLVTRDTGYYRRAPTRLTPPFMLPPAL